jgi:hypothetical protein
VLDITVPKIPRSLPDEIGEMYRRFITPNDQVLIDTVFAALPSQEKLDECLRVCDIEVMGAHKTLLLSYFMQEHPELRFSEYAGPRIKGLIDFFRFANIKLFSHFCRIGKELNAAGIPMLVLKGAAMKLLRPEFPRVMGDVDILIPLDRMLDALEISERLGYRDAFGRNAQTKPLIALDLLAPDGGYSLDIHGTVPASGGSETFREAMFTRARPCNAFGIPALLPAVEDMFFILLNNLEESMREKSSLHSLFFSLVDCRFLLGSNGFNWEIVRNNIQETHTEYQTRFAAEFMNTLVPGIVPGLEEHFPLNESQYLKEVKIRRKKWLSRHNRAVFDWEFMEKKADACRRILLVEFKRRPRHYAMMMFKLFLMRKLRVFPFFIRWYLRRHNAGIFDAC